MCQPEAIWAPTYTASDPPASLHSIIRGVNQDRFIQRAIEAANAYSSILRAVQAAEGAAGEALQQAGRTWTVRPCPRSLEPLPSGSHRPGVQCVLPHVCRWWYSRAWPPEPGSYGPTAVPWRRPFSGSSRGWAAVSAGTLSLWHTRGGCAVSPWRLPCVGTLSPLGGVSSPGGVLHRTS